MEIVCRMRSNCQKEPWFGKSSSFACFMKYISRKLLWCHKKQCTTLHMFGSCRSTSSCLANQWLWLRSSHQRCSIKKGVLKTCAKFIGKHLCQRLFFNKVVGVSFTTLLKKRFWHRCFPMNFEKFLTAPFLQNTSGRLLLLIPQNQWVYIAMGFFYGHMLSSAVSVIFE